MPVDHAPTPDPDAPEELERADAIVLEALDADPAAWPTLIDERCGDDAALRQEVESLLYVERSLLDRADQPVFELVGSGAQHEDRIGPWQILDVLGEGGAATVYRARRIDSDDPRPVALKLLRRGTGTTETVRRLRREGKILAGLRHPSIVPLLGGGVTDDGRPFLVMEWVDGETLDRHVERTAPAMVRRVDLVLALAEAVHYAHGRLVVHGDLKPTNVLIDSAGAPRLLDFGIAKLLDPETETPWTLTATGARMLTPAYASPEQVRRQPLGVATDVWALGVILFELLTGERPFAIDGPGLDAWRTICEEEAPRPSTVLRRRGDPRGARAVAGDLDAIVARALRKEPEARYGSVRELADDLRRQRRGEPVRARRGTFTYRTGKFIRRHRGRLVATTLLVALLATILVDRERQRDRIVQERDAAERVRDVLIEIFESADPETLSGGDEPVRDVLGRAAGVLDERSLEPAVRAELLGVLGEVHTKLGLHDDAGKMLTEALTLEQSLDRPRSRGETLRRLGRLAHEQGRYDVAEAHLTEALALIDTEATPRRHVAMARNDLGFTLLALGRNDQAETAFRSAATVFEALGDPEALTIQENLAQVHLARGEPERAAAIFERTLAERQRRFGPRHVLVADSAANLGAVRFYLDEIDPAIASTRSAADIWSERLGPNHSRTITGLGNLAAMLSTAGRLDEAEALLVDVLERLHDSGRDRHPLAASYRLNLANVHVERDDQARALPLIEDALAIRRALYPATHAEIGRALDSLGSVYSNLGYPECEGDSGRSIDACRKALATFGESWAILRRALGPSHPEAYASGVTFAMHSFDLDAPGTTEIVANLVATGREHPELPERQRAYVLRVLATLRLAEESPAQVEALIEAWRAVGIDWSGDEAEWQEPYADLLVAVARQRQGLEVDVERVAAAVHALSSAPIAEVLAVMPGRQTEWLAWRDELTRGGDAGAPAPASPGSIGDRR